LNRVLLFSLTAMVNPTLVAATTVMLLLPSPKRLMLGYLGGAYFTSITLGIVIVLALGGSNSTTSSAKHTINPIVDLAVGAIFLVIGVVLGTSRDRRLRERRAERKSGQEHKTPRWQQELAKGSPRVTFLVGAVLTLPGASYLAGLTSLRKLNYSPAGVVATVILMNLIMLALIELPLISFTVAPDWTPRAIERVKAAFSDHGHTALFVGTTALGVLLIVRGVITLLT
jgi:Sap, sulfolipid-1-addressing protein